MSNTVKTNDENSTPLNELELRKIVDENVSLIGNDNEHLQTLLMAQMRGVREMFSKPGAIVAFGDSALRIEVDIRATEDQDVGVSLRVNGGKWQSHGTTLNISDDDTLRKAQGYAITQLAIGCLADLKLTREQAEEHILVLTYLFLFANTVSETDPSLALSFIDKAFVSEQKIAVAA